MTDDAWTILYRGPLSSCNYACTYCPFAKTRNTRAELADDAIRLDRFVQWVQEIKRPVRLLFTPWGEALVHRAYQQALATLSHTPHVGTVSIQTNLACKLEWLDTCDWTRAALWTTWHPTQTPRQKFLAQCERLETAGARYSVGVVGMKEHFDEIERLREELPPHVYLWVNAYKRDPAYYSSEEIRQLTDIDPVFPVNNHRHASLGRACRAGHTAFTVDGDGQARRCHFIKDVIGNIYEPDFPARLAPRPCGTATCGCHIGYIHMDSPGLTQVFGDQTLERIPLGWPHHRPDPAQISALAEGGVAG